jgi:hypothetical protein
MTLMSIYTNRVSGIPLASSAQASGLKREDRYSTFACEWLVRVFHDFWSMSRRVDASNFKLKGRRDHFNHRPDGTS